MDCGATGTASWRFAALLLWATAGCGDGDPKPVKHERPLLFNLAVDPSEAHDIGEQHPDVIKRITAAVEAHRARTPKAPSQLIETVPVSK